MPFVLTETTHFPFSVSSVPPFLSRTKSNNNNNNKATTRGIGDNEEKTTATTPTTETPTSSTSSLIDHEDHSHHNVEVEVVIRITGRRNFQRRQLC
jgi:hypothetical protein